PPSNQGAVIGRDEVHICPVVADGEPGQEHIAESAIRHELDDLFSTGDPAGPEHPDRSYPFGLGLAGALQGERSDRGPLWPGGAGAKQRIDRGGRSAGPGLDLDSLQPSHVPDGTDTIWYMTRDGSARQRLLAAAVEYVATHGVGDLSLRQLAAGIGTSHRMLLYHFGSREGLLQAVVHEVEQRQRQALAGLWEEASRSGVDPATVTWQFWRRLSDPALWPLERLFFELYGRSLAGGGGEAD